MNFFLNKFIKLNVLNLVGIYRSDEGDGFSLLKIKKKKDRLDIVESLMFSDLQSLLLKIDKSIPVIMLVDGKGILNKKIDLKIEADTQWLKNLDYTSIHYTSYKTEETDFFSFCRRNIVLEYLEVFETAELRILDFYVGALTAVLMKDAIAKNSYYANLTQLHFAGDTLMDITKLDKTDIQEQYKIGEKDISNYHISLYGAAINFYIAHSAISKSSIEKISPDEILYKKAFEKLGVIMLAGFFILLLASYGFTQYLIKSNATLTIENSYTNKSYGLIKDLETKRTNKLQILKETGFSSGRFISYYCCEIAKSVPQEISLSVLDVYPVKAQIKKTEKIAASYRTIVINGQTGNKLVFNTWIDYLRQQKWIRTLEIVSIKRDKKDITYFELKIAITDV